MPHLSITLYMSYGNPGKQLLTD